MGVSADCRRETATCSGFDDAKVRDEMALDRGLLKSVDRLVPLPVVEATFHWHFEPNNKESHIKERSSALRTFDPKNTTQRIALVHILYVATVTLSTVLSQI